MSKPNIIINKTENGITINIAKEDLLNYIIDSNEDIFEFDMNMADDIVQDFANGLAEHMVTEDFFDDIYRNCDLFEKEYVKRV